MFFKSKQVLGLLLQGVLRWCLGGREDCSAKASVGRVTPGRPMLHISEAGLDLSLFFLTSLV